MVKLLLQQTACWMLRLRCTESKSVSLPLIGGRGTTAAADWAWLPSPDFKILELHHGPLTDTTADQSAPRSLLVSLGTLAPPDRVSLPLLGFQGLRLRGRVDKGAAYEFKSLVYEDDREGKEEDEQPLVQGERHDGEDGCQDRHVEDQEVQAEGQRHGHQEPRIAPRWHLQQRVVLRTQIGWPKHLHKCLRCHALSNVGGEGVQAQQKKILHQQLKVAQLRHLQQYVSSGHAETV